MDISLKVLVNTIRALVVVLTLLLIHNHHAKVPSEFIDDFRYYSHFGKIIAFAGLALIPSLFITKPSASVFISTVAILPLLALVYFAFFYN